MTPNDVYEERWVDPRAPEVKLFRGDSRVVLEAMASNLVSVDVVCTDPPYGINYKGMTHKAIANDEAPPVWCVELMANLLKPDAAMFVCTREDVAEVWRDEMHRIGLRIQPSVQWDKLQWTMGDSAASFRRQTEMILIAHTGRALLVPWTWGDLKHWLARMAERAAAFLPDELLLTSIMSEKDIAALHTALGIHPVDKEVKRDTNVWTFPVPRDRHSQLHPTPKPPEIMERALLSHSLPGDVVLDPFMGGGPVGVAAVRQGRRYLGIELDAGYFELAKENITKALDDRDAEQEL